jgi:ribose 5-phosphate isomerase A
MKLLAAEKAVEYVKDGMVIGLGTGSTTEYAIKKIGELVKEGLDILCIPTSIRTEELAKKYSISLSTLTEHPRIDLTIDGADEVDPNLNLIKGMGGALFREKVVAKSSDVKIIVVDHTKLVTQLGMKSPLPVEVVPFAYRYCETVLSKLGCIPTLRLINDRPYITDNHNYIIDCKFEVIKDPYELDEKLHATTGIVETGLFIGLADIVLVGTEEGVKELSS